MRCGRCDSSRLLAFFYETGDRLELIHAETGVKYRGVTPRYFLRGGDADWFPETDLCFSACLDCGQVQDEVDYPFPPIPELGESEGERADIKHEVTCSCCQSSRLLRVIAQVGDQLSLVYEKTPFNYTGPVPACFLNSGADTPNGSISFSLCGDCGQVQDTFPAPPIPELGELASVSA